MAEPTSALTFGDLILEVAIKAGLAYYGENGDEAPQVPVDAHDLAESKRIVNNAIRMFIKDAPPTGWRWTRPTASLILWPTVEESASVTVTGGAFSGGQTTITATAASFYPSMEGKTLSIDGVGDFTIASYTSATVIVVTGDASTAAADMFSITADGNYTLPQSFGGGPTGVISYAAGTNQAVPIQWTGEGRIRQARENEDLDTDWPRWAAVRIREDRRRWELMVDPVPHQVMTVEFPYDLHFDELVDLTDLPPSPYMHDETLKAACLAVLEKDTEDQLGVAWAYYKQDCLPQSHNADARTAPRKLGYFGNPDLSGINPSNFRDFRSRPTVTFTP